MEVKAIHRNARMSPRKIRPVGRVVRGLSVANAESQLTFMSGKAAEIIKEVLKSAVANAVHNFDMKKEDLKVSDVVVGAGITFKRFNPVAKGMAHPILKRNAHVTVVVTGEEVKRKGIKKRKQNKIETLSATQFVGADNKETSTKVRDIAKAKDGISVKANEERSIETKMDKTQEAFQIKKMQQMGGDSKKTHRRKTI